MTGLRLLGGCVLLTLLVQGSPVLRSTGPGSGIETEEAWRPRIPPRPLQAMNGSEFATRTAKMSGPARQQEALAQLKQGNVPESLRHFAPIRLRHQKSDGEVLEGVLWVSPDYLAIGSDEDSLRIPLTYPSAVSIARTFGCFLPTAKIVDTIFEQADCRVEPQFLPPGKNMRSTEYYLRHRSLVETQLQKCRTRHLTVGQKKDIVLSNRLRQRSNRIAIYGWHRTNGTPVQPLSIVHGARYADYSHGVRLISETVWINGKPHSVQEVLNDPELAPLLTYEGRISNPRDLMTVSEQD